MRSIFRAVLVATSAFAALVGPCVAQTSHFSEHDKLIRADRTVGTLGADLFGDKVHAVRCQPAWQQRTAGLAAIDDPVAWNDTTLAFEPVPYAEHDLPASHWRQTVATGNARTVTYFDALWRPWMPLSRDFRGAYREPARTS